MKAGLKIHLVDSVDEVFRIAIIPTSGNPAEIAAPDVPPSAPPVTH